MDILTIKYYDSHAKNIANEHVSLCPKELYKIIKKYFPHKGKFLDVGCGIGRDTNWLANQGFNVIGVDASKGMLQQAKSRYPHINFIQDKLPSLTKFKDTTCTGILCSAVLMHLNENALTKALATMFKLLISKGVFICSFRHSNNNKLRENGKLYTPINLKYLQECIIQQGFNIVTVNKTIESQRRHLWFTIVAKK